MASKRLSLGTLALVIVWGATNFAVFPKGVLDFGFSPDYLKIASDTVEFGGYSVRLPNYLSRLGISQLPPDVQAVASTKSMVISEVQREPMYPFALILVRWVTGSFGDIIWLQLACLLLSVYLWGMFALLRFGWQAAAAFFVLMFLSTVPQFYISVLYPYAFQFLFVTAGALLLIRGVERQQRVYYILAGVCLGGAAYERNAYLLLPAALFAILFVLAGRLGIRRRHLFLFVLSASVAVAPWLARDLRLGVLGMNQMTGYTLGYTYGDLVEPTESPFVRSYTSLLRCCGRDPGTLYFIEDHVLDGSGSFSQVDRQVAQLVIKGMIAHPDVVIGRILAGIIAFPSRLGTLDLRKYQAGAFEDPVAFYQTYEMGGYPSALDLVILVLAVRGLSTGVSRFGSDAVIICTILLYSLFVFTTVVNFDPRYRGALDPMLYAFAGKAVGELLAYLGSARPRSRVLIADSMGAEGGARHDAGK